MGNRAGRPFPCPLPCLHPSPPPQYHGKGEKPRGNFVYRALMSRDTIFFDRCRQTKLENLEKDRGSASRAAWLAGTGSFRKTCEKCHKRVFFFRVRRGGQSNFQRLAQVRSATLGTHFFAFGKKRGDGMAKTRRKYGVPAKKQKGKSFVFWRKSVKTVLQYSQTYPYCDTANVGLVTKIGFYFPG